MKGLLALVLLGAALPAAAAPYQVHEPVQGEIRIWGSPEDADLIKLWEAGFRRYQPEARISAQLHGPESTVASLYTDVADIAFIGRELRLPVENMAFQWVKLYGITTIEVANAALSANRLAANIVVVVHPDNPLAGLTLAQLDGIFGAEHKAAGRNLRTWGDVGLTGAWRDRPIAVKAPAVDSIAAIFFRRVVLGNSFKWNPELQEFPSEAAAVAAVARDPNAIAYARLASVQAGVKALPLAAKAGAPFVTLNATTAEDRSYPLARSVIVAIDRKPGRPPDARVREFLRFVLSDEGQAAVARDGAYLPLTAGESLAQIQRLEAP